MYKKFGVLESPPQYEQDIKERVLYYLGEKCNIRREVNVTATQLTGKNNYVDMFFYLPTEIGSEKLLKISKAIMKDLTLEVELDINERRAFLIVSVQDE